MGSLNWGCPRYTGSMICRGRRFDVWVVLRILWGKLDCIVWAIHLVPVERDGNELNLRSSIRVERSENEVTVSMNQIRMRRVANLCAAV